MKSVSLSLSSCLLKSRLGEYKCSFVLEIAVSLPMLNSGFFFLLAPPLFITTSVWGRGGGGGEVYWFRMSFPACFNDLKRLFCERTTAAKCRKPSNYSNLLPNISRLSGSRL